MVLAAPVMRRFEREAQCSDVGNPETRYLFLGRALGEVAEKLRLRSLDAVQDLHTLQAV